MRSLRALPIAAAVLAAMTALAEEPRELATIGRIRFSEARKTEAIRAVEDRAALGALVHTPEEGRAFPAIGILSTTHNPVTGNVEVLRYDYANDEMALWRHRPDANAIDIEEGLGRNPFLSPKWEFQAAAAVVARDPRWAAGLADGSLLAAQAMPPVTYLPDGRRTINVVIHSTRANERHELDVHTIVSVHPGTETVVTYPGNAPPLALAGRQFCAINNLVSCSTTNFPFVSQAVIEWPAENPVWSFRATRPESTDQLDTMFGSGIRLDDVHFKGERVLARADAPILTVQYRAGCGPYRDWLYDEHCFQVDSPTDVPGAPGFAVAASAPTTVCQSPTSDDSGNFSGVAIYDEGESLLLTSEMTAGWYRYIMGWRFHTNGRLEPIFTFGSAGTSTCVCNEHWHHVYWRFEWAIGGSAAEPHSGKVAAEYTENGTSWTSVETEATLNRPEAHDTQHWRFRNPTATRGWRLRPGPRDGSFLTDPTGFGQADVWVVRHRDGEVNDQDLGPNQPVRASADINRWVNGEAVGLAADSRTVLWYHAWITNDYLGSGRVPGVDPEECVTVGPVIEPIEAGADSAGTRFIFR